MADASMRSASSTAVEQLKALLLSGDRQKIKALEKELQELRLSLSDKEAFLKTLDPVIAESLARKVIESPQEIAGAMAPVIGPAIKQQIKSAKEDIVDALYPVIGQSIRKAVAEAMKNLARTVNEKLDSALSFRLFRKRIEARLKGVSPGEAVLKEVLTFQIQEIFYIHKQSGILLAHASASHDDESTKDVISGMLTAIKNFSQDALGGNPQDLNVIEYDDFRIYLENGRYAFLAVVISGIPPDRFYRQMKELETALHKQFADKLRDFDGRVENFKAAQELLSASLQAFTPTGDQAPSAPRWIKISVVALLVLCTAALIWFATGNTEQQQNPPVVTHLFNREQVLKKLQRTLGPNLKTSLKDLRFIVKDNVLYVQGAAADAGEGLLIARELARFTSFPVIIDEMRMPARFDSSKMFKEQLRIYFPAKSARLNAIQKARLDSILPLLQKPATKKIFIEGYSDASGSARFNYEISLKRALSVRNYLISRGIDPRYVFVSGKGTPQPGRPHKTKAQQARDRRVSIRIMNVEKP